MNGSDENEVNRIGKAKEAWEANRLKKNFGQSGEKENEEGFKSDSGYSVKGLYTPLDLAESEWNYLDKLGFPGEYPYTRGIAPDMYREKPPRMVLYSGYGSAEATNQRYKYLFAQGVKEVSIASDLPTQIGYDSDNPLASGEVAKIGCAIDSLADMEVIFDGIKIDEIFIGIQTNATSPIHFAFLAAAAEKQGVTQEQIRVIIQNDILKEYVARGTYIFPPEPAMKFSCDLVEYVVKNGLSATMTPMYYTGYHFREAGGNAVHEMAFTLVDAIAYIEELLSRGISIDDLPRQMILFVAGLDLFEEVAKYRAFRRIFARIMKERYGCTNPRVLGIEYRTGSQATRYTAQQPLNNIVRGTISALVEVLSGVQMVSVAAFDEALAIPSENSATLVLRTLQIVAEETGLTSTADPLAGSYYVESLTDKLEEEALSLFDKMQAMGGAIACIESGYMEREIGKNAYEQIKQIKEGRKVVVGLNKYRTDEKISYEIMRVDPQEEERQIQKVKRLRKERDNRKVEIALKEVKECAIEGINLVSPIIAAAKEYATIGEICDVLRQVYGEHHKSVY